MKIECVTTCVGYADYLSETLPRNLCHFDRVVVVTSLDDPETRELCRKLSVECYATDLFTTDGPFTKARGVDFGLSYVRYNDWVVHLDADTYLPPNTRRVLDRKTLDRSFIYGVDRVNCVGFEKWKAFVAQAHPGHDYLCRVPVPGGLPLLDRIAIDKYGGYLPIGYFQLWHMTTGRRYPIASGTAERDDVLHAMQWPATKRLLIPEIISVHLMAGPAALGANWKGRTTPRFGPPSPIGDKRKAYGHC